MADFRDDLPSEPDIAGGCVVEAQGRPPSPGRYFGEYDANGVDL